MRKMKENKKPKIISEIKTTLLKNVRLKIYKCLDCGLEWAGLAGAKKCPTCDSKNIKVKEERR